MANRRQYILQTVARRRVIKHFVGGNQGKPGALRSRAQPGFANDIFFPSMPGNQAVKSITEGIAQIIGNLV